MLQLKIFFKSARSINFLDLIVFATKIFFDNVKVRGQHSFEMMRYEINWLNVNLLIKFYKNPSEVF